MIAGTTYDDMSGEHIHTLKNFQKPDESGILGNETKMRSRGMAAQLFFKVWMYSPDISAST